MIAGWSFVSDKKYVTIIAFYVNLWYNCVVYVKGGIIMEENEKINDSIDVIDELVSDGVVQDLSDDQLQKTIDLINEIQELLEK